MDAGGHAINENSVLSIPFGFEYFYYRLRVHGLILEL
jgi:hypothetical protein